MEKKNEKNDINSAETCKSEQTVLIQIRLLKRSIVEINTVTTVELQWLEHLWLVYHGCFELVLETLGKSPIVADFDNLV